MTITILQKILLFDHDKYDRISDNLYDKYDKYDMTSMTSMTLSWFRVF
jgi:hypothetical protein